MHIFATIWFGLLLVTLLALKVALLVQGFKRHYAWGLVMLLVPFSVTAFVVLHWDRARRPFLLWACATAALTMEYVLVILFGVAFGVL